jgi:hypothetical protein
VQEEGETMSPAQLRWAAVLAAALALPVAVRAADPWWIVKPTPHAAPARPAAPAAAIDRPLPAATLGRPLPATDGAWDAPKIDAAAPGWDSPTTTGALTAAGYDEAPGGFPPPRVVRGQPPDPGALTGPPPVPPVADGNYNAGVDAGQPLHRPFLEGCRDWFNFGRHPSANGGAWFKSDCFCEDSMISPVTNPFFFEDPRALTEIKPLFIIQKAPRSEGGGNDEFYGIQGRLAVTERFSLVLNKLGFVSFNPSQPVNDFGKHTGFAEVNFGPKWTFWQDDSLRNAAAVGLTIEAPVGSHKVAQDTGTLGLDPYLSYAQSFGDSSIGSFNFIGEIGYSFAVDDDRTQFFHASAHLDYDILRRHKWYPLLEMNWFEYTRHGNQSDLGFEGADLFNFGSHTSRERELITIAPGLRYKFTEWAQFGTAVEFPLTTEKSRIDPRWMVDLIFRY